MHLKDGKTAQPNAANLLPWPLLPSAVHQGDSCLAPEPAAPGALQPPASPPARTFSCLLRSLSASFAASFSSLARCRSSARRCLSASLAASRSARSSEVSRLPRPPAWTGRREGRPHGKACGSVPSACTTDPCGISGRGWGYAAHAPSARLEWQGARLPTAACGQRRGTVAATCSAPRHAHGSHPHTRGHGR